MKIVADGAIRYLDTEPHYQTEPDYRLIQEASGVDVVDGVRLWVGDSHCLSREEVIELADHLVHWLEHGRLREPEATTSSA